MGAALAFCTNASGPALAQGVIQAVPESFNAGGFRFSLTPDAQTLQTLSPGDDTKFSFVTDGSNVPRQGAGFNHVGDIHLRLRSAGGAWRDYASQLPKGAIVPLRASGKLLAAADISAELGDGLPLKVVRRWMDVNGTLTLRFVLTNISQAPVEIGLLGMPMVFSSILDKRTIEQNNALSAFADPYIGRDAGYLQVTRLSGGGPALLVLPEPGTPFEAYAPILQDTASPAGAVFTDKTQISQTFEGFYDWSVASAGLVNNEWKAGGTPWNAPTSIVLAPNESRTVGLRFVQSPSIRSIGDTLAANGRPETVAVPGYVVPTDMDATLYIKTHSQIVATAVEPAGNLAVEPQGNAGGYTRLGIHGLKWGRARLSLTYANGAVQTVSYYVAKPLDQVAADLGRFTTTQQWFDDRHDPFGRSPAILTYDREANAIVTQDPRVWIAGMSDEGGAGGWVAAAMKQLDNPDPAEVSRLEQLITRTVSQRLQIPQGDMQGAVRKSLFYYDPANVTYSYDSKIDWTSWASWNKTAASAVDRAYDYPHVAIGYWAMYRLARNHIGLVTQHDWNWYLQHAYQTVVGMMADAPYYTQYGLMEGSVFVSLLDDLKSEPAYTMQAANMERLMKGRATAWSKMAAPYGSEMAWDSTGQEEVYAWERYFGYAQQALITRESILAFDPAVPGWGYNGNVRRYWDFLYGGKIPGIERQIYHYGATLNSLPLFDSFRADPSDTHLLRVAYGSFLGGITNIDRQGFGSAAFHSDPALMKWDPYTGDYGMGFFGHAYAAATYLVQDHELGWLAYGGNLVPGSGAMTVIPKDGARSRLFIGPAGVWIQLEAGKIAAVRYAKGSGTVRLLLDPATRTTPSARVFVSNTVDPSKPYTVRGGIYERGGYTVKLGNGIKTIEVGPAGGK